MNQQEQPVRLRFESFELDLHTGELHKEGHVIKLQDQPMKLLALLASRPGELVTRAEIEKKLWSDSTFIEFEHGINTAIRKIRDALNDDPDKPRFIETLPRKGYRFITPVEACSAAVSAAGARAPRSSEQKERVRDADRAAGADASATTEAYSPAVSPNSPLATVSNAATLPREEFALSRGPARVWLLVIQCGYLAMYCSALYYTEPLEQVLERVLLLPAALSMPFIMVAAMCGIAVRLYLLSAVGLDHPATGVKFKKLFPALLVLDSLWAASPLLLARKMGYGLALASVAGLAYLPFSQRTLIQSAYRGGHDVAVQG